MKRPWEMTWCWFRGDYTKLGDQRCIALRFTPDADIPGPTLMTADSSGDTQAARNRTAACVRLAAQAPAMARILRDQYLARVTGESRGHQTPIGELATVLRDAGVSLVARDPDLG